MSAYKEFTGKSVEDALRAAREEFGAGLDDLDFEILTPGSRGVLGMGAEPARIVAAPRSELGGAAPKREAAASRPLPPPPPRDDRPRDDRSHGDRDRGPRRDDHGGRSDQGRPPRSDQSSQAPRADAGTTATAERPTSADRPPAAERPTTTDRPARPPREDRGHATTIAPGATTALAGRVRPR